VARFELDQVTSLLDGYNYMYCSFTAETFNVKDIIHITLDVHNPISLILPNGKGIMLLDALFVVTRVLGLTDVL